MSSGGFGPPAPSGPAQLALTQTSVNQNHEKPTVLEQNAIAQDIRSPSKRQAEKSFEGESLKEDVQAGQSETALKDANNTSKDGSVKSATNQEKGGTMGSLEQSFGGKSFETGFAEAEFRKEDTHSLTDHVNLDNHMKLSKTAVAGQSSAIYERQSLSAGPPSSTEGHILPPKTHGSYGPQHVVRQNDVTMPRDRMLGSGEGGPLVKPHADDPSFLRSNGGPAPDSSMFGPRDENMKPLSREQLNFFPREPNRLHEQGEVS